MSTSTAQGRRRGLVVYQLVLILIAVALLIGLLLYLSKQAPAATESVARETPALTAEIRNPGTGTAPGFIL